MGRSCHPLGFLAPVTIKFKVFFQKLCRGKLERDVNLFEELGKGWNDLVNDLGEGGPISIPRSYFNQVNGSPVSLTLCGFCDASTHTHAAVVYLVMKTDLGTRVRLWCLKQEWHHYGRRQHHA